MTFPWGQNDYIGYGLTWWRTARFIGFDAATVQPSGARIFGQFLVWFGLFFGGFDGELSGIGAGLRVGGSACGEHNLPRCSIALVPDHEYVIAGAIEELGEHIARLSRTVGAKDSLVGSRPSTLAPVAAETSSKICLRLEFRAVMSRPRLSQVTEASAGLSLAGQLGGSGVGGVSGAGATGACALSGWAWAGCLRR